MRDDYEVKKLKLRNHCLKLQTRNLQRQIKSLESRNKRNEEILLEVSRSNCSFPQAMYETYQGTLDRLTSRLMEDGQALGKADPKYLIPEVLEAATNLKKAMRIAENGT